SRRFVCRRVCPPQEPSGSSLGSEEPLGWLIDTGIWIAVERGQLGAADVHAVTRQEPVYLSPVNVAEMQFGLGMLRTGPQKQKAAAALRRLRRKPQLRITVASGEVFGDVATDLSTARRVAEFLINDVTHA